MIYIILNNGCYFSNTKFYKSKSIKHYRSEALILTMKNQFIAHSQIKQQTAQNEQLQVLLQTNTILIENKKMIYQAKIKTYIKQIDKITKLLQAKRRKQLITHQEQDDQDNDEYDQQESDDASEEERQKISLQKKLYQIQTKKNQSIQKLQMIDKIQKDIRVTQVQEQSSKTNENADFHNTQRIGSKTKEKQRCKSVHTKKQEILIISQNKQNNPLKKQIARKSLIETHKKDSQEKKKQPKQSQQKEWRIKQKSEKLIESESIQRPSLVNTIYQELNRSDQKEILGQRKRRHTQQQIKINNFTISQQGTLTNPILNNGKYLLVKDENCSNEEQLLLWTSRQNDEKEMFSNNSQRALPQKMINISQVCKNKNERKDPTPSPVSIANSRSKLHENNKHQTNAKMYAQEMDPILQNQYKILLEQVHNIISIINSAQHSNKSPQIKVGSENNNKSIFKQIYDNLIKIKHYLQQQQDQKEQQLTQRQNYTNFKSKQKQLTTKILRLQQQQNRISKQLIKIQQECEIYCTKIQEKQNKYKVISKQIQQIDSYKVQIQNNMDDLIHAYQSNLKEVHDQLNSIYQSIKISTTQRENPTTRDKSKRKYEQQKINMKPKFDKNQSNISIKILRMYDYIRNFTQTQKMTALEYKQSVLSLEYQITALKNQEKRFQISLKESSDIIEKMDATVKQREKQANKLSKEKQKLSKQVLQLRTEVQEYQNLVAIRKNCYNELQTKYNSMKSKKSKVEKNLSAMQIELSQRQSKVDKIQTNFQRRQRHLQQINEQVKNILKNKEDLINQIQKIDSQVMEKTQKIKEMENITQKREQNIRKLDKKICQLQQRIEKAKQNEAKYQQRIGNINEEINKANQDLNDKQWNLTNLNSEVKNVEKILKQTTQSFQRLSTQMKERQKAVKMLAQSECQIESKIKLYLEQIRKLEQAKQQLEQALVEILQKKQESVKFITIKYEQLQSLEHQIEGLSYQIQQHQQMMTNLITQTNQLNQTYKTLSDQCGHLQKEEASIKTKLGTLFEQIEFNRDQQENLHERVRKLKQIQTKLLIQIGVKAYNPNSKSDQSTKQLSSLLPAEMKQQIQSIMQELAEATITRQKYNKQKQQNRKLRLDNQRLRKIYEMEMNIDDSIT